ncbi:MAG TPA: hypothetical protein VKV21_00260 [Solirubrobacteraceae bacterium]|nr:hypothetical protein [Solirubrobacteraceae bacterium]
MSEFLEPPPRVRPEQAPPVNPPPWTGRPAGAPLGAAVGDLLLAQSELATVRIAYIDAYPEGFELEIRALARVAYDDLRRGDDEPGPDVFGRHWPLVDEPDDALPSQLLRIGVRFADGRLATNVAGHDRPMAGPTMWPLSGGGSGAVRGCLPERAPESRFHQGYWLSPLPPPGPLEIACEWPVAWIPVVRRRVDARVIIDAAERGRAMFGDGRHVERDGRRWRLGTGEDAAWINDGTSPGLTITSAVPPAFDAYCTVELPRTHEDAERERHERAVIDLLDRHTPPQPWWLGYLDTGASDVVFPYAPRTTIYSGYGYVLVQAGPREAARWRERGFSWALPELMFPADRSWLVSTMWDDAWSSIGGSEQLVDRLLSDPLLGPRTRRVPLDQDATPPGHAAI